MVLKPWKGSKLRDIVERSQGIVKFLVRRASIRFTVSIATLDRGRKGTRPGAPNGVTIPFTVVPEASPPGREAPTTRIGSTCCGDAAVSINENLPPFTIGLASFIPKSLCGGATIAETTRRWRWARLEVPFSARL